MKTLLICHDGELLDQHVLPSWLATFSTLTGVVVIREPRRLLLTRARREVRRVGVPRFLDVLAFRLYYSTFLARRDRRWEQEALRRLRRRFPPETGVPRLLTPSPNSSEAERFIREHEPELVLARCKFILAERVFSIPDRGTFVMHPGICPEYRNSHGCFWALARGDRQHVGMTLLRIDRGVDTGPVYGYFGALCDEVHESHVVIQHRVVYDNLNGIAGTLKRIWDGSATPIDTTGRSTRMWGQPWLTAFLKWKADAARRATHVAAEPPADPPGSYGLPPTEFLEKPE